MPRPSKEQIRRDLESAAMSGSDAARVLTTALRYAVSVPFDVYLVRGRVELRKRRDQHERDRSPA